MIDLEWYRSFVAVYQAGTVTAAAKRLFRTQPTVSQHIAALETALGQTLFRREPRRMVANAEAQALYAQIIGPIEQLDKTQPGYGAPRAAPPTLRLGCPHDFFHTVLLGHLSELTTPVRLHFGATPQLLAQLEDDALDVVLATHPPDNSALAATAVYEETFRLVAPADTELADFATAPDNTAARDGLLGQTWLAYAPDLPIVRRFWRANFNERPPIEPRYVIPSLISLRDAVVLGMGVSLLPDYLLTQHIAQGKLCYADHGLRRVSNQLFWVQKDRPAPTAAAAALMATMMAALAP